MIFCKYYLLCIIHIYFGINLNKLCVVLIYILPLVPILSNALFYCTHNVKAKAKVEKRVFQQPGDLQGEMKHCDVLMLIRDLFKVTIYHLVKNGPTATGMGERRTTALQRFTSEANSANDLSELLRAGAGLESVNSSCRGDVLQRCIFSHCVESFNRPI